MQPQLPALTPRPGFRPGLRWLPRRRALLHSGRFEAAAGRLGAVDLVLARSLCRHGRFDLSAVPPAKRSGALRLKLAGWAPYADVGSAVIWSADGVASVWCWDAARVRDASEVDAGGRTQTFARVLPETALQAPLPQGLRMVRCLDGFEGQCWQTSALLASRWWPAAPTADDWLAFQRSAGVPAPDQALPPHAQDLPLLPRPWSAVTAVDRADGELASWEPWTRVALLLCLGVPAAVMAVREVQFHRERDQLNRQLAALRSDASPRLAARASALAARDRVRAIDDLQRYPQPLALMAAMADSLPAERVLLREWDMADGNLRVQLASTGGASAGTDQVAALEKTGLFEGVKIVTVADPRQTAFAMRLRGVRELEVPPARSAPVAPTPASQRRPGPP